MPAELGLDVWLENRDASTCAVTTVSSMFTSYERGFQNRRCGIHWYTLVSRLHWVSFPGNVHIQKVNFLPFVVIFHIEVPVEYNSNQSAFHFILMISIRSNRHTSLRVANSFLSRATHAHERRISRPRCDTRVAIAWHPKHGLVASSNSCDFLDKTLASHSIAAGDEHAMPIAKDAGA